MCSYALLLLLTPAHVTPEERKHIHHYYQHPGSMLHAECVCVCMYMGYLDQAYIVMTLGKEMHFHKEKALKKTRSSNAQVKSFPPQQPTTTSFFTLSPSTPPE